MLMPGLHATGIVVGLESAIKMRKIHLLSLSHFDDVLPSRKMKLGMAHLHTSRKFKKKFRNPGT